MRSQSGFGSILMASIVLLMVVTFMGSASVYFNSLYRDLMIQQRAVAADVVMEDFGKMVQYASHTFASTSGVCPAVGATTYEIDTVNRLCWPMNSGASAGANCVRNPIGNSTTGSTFVCRRTASGNQIENRNSMTVSEIDFELRQESLPFFSHLKNTLIASIENFDRGLVIVAGELQNFAIAQTSDTVYLPGLGGAPTANFSTALNCPAAGLAVNHTDAPYCKYCDPASAGRLQSCVRLRVCLNPQGCPDADSSRWSRRTIGIISR